MGFSDPVTQGRGIGTVDPSGRKSPYEALAGARESPAWLTTVLRARALRGAASYLSLDSQEYYPAITERIIRFSRRGIVAIGTCDVESSRYVHPSGCFTIFSFATAVTPVKSLFVQRT